MPRKNMSFGEFPPIIELGRRHQNDSFVVDGRQIEECGRQFVTRLRTNVDEFRDFYMVPLQSSIVYRFLIGPDSPAAGSFATPFVGFLVPAIII